MNNTSIMNNTPNWFKKCLLYNNISKKFDISIDINEIVLRYLFSHKKYQSLINELNKEIISYQGKKSISFSESYLQYKSSLIDYIHREHEIYTDSPIEDISRYLTLYKCPLDFANKQMIDACYPHLHGIYQDNGNMEMVNSPILQANIFLEHVNPPWIRPSQERMSLENKRDQFYKHSEKHVEDEAEYYVYLIKSLLLKGLPLKEIK